jgi:hypothetical protein
MPATQIAGQDLVAAEGHVAILVVKQRGVRHQSRSSTPPISRQGAQVMVDYAFNQVEDAEAHQHRAG